MEDVPLLIALALFGAIGSNGFAAGVVVLLHLLSPATSVRLWTSLAGLFTAAFSALAMGTIAITADAVPFTLTGYGSIAVGASIVAAFFAVLALPLALFVARRLDSRRDIASVFE